MEERCGMTDVPLVVLLTKVDKACPSLEKDLRKVYRSRYIKELVRQKCKLAEDASNLDTETETEAGLKSDLVSTRGKRKMNSRYAFPGEESDSDEENKGPCPEAPAPPPALHVKTSTLRDEPPLSNKRAIPMAPAPPVPIGSSPHTSPLGVTDSIPPLEVMATSSPKTKTILLKIRFDFKIFDVSSPLTSESNKRKLESTLSLRHSRIPVSNEGLKGNT
ncbi:uncharacterized protein LOC125723419 [Brienomyrus brachyistius]|uniref:uncharacterized protein LOC125723419 n=1 Tax=Brienomyrus brachyistius TaxID=42636 RepID=UPI0020B1A4D9|nr:uncharacterized protein LOC125723419 [Brienomyrus brachyistius]